MTHLLRAVAVGILAVTPASAQAPQPRRVTDLRIAVLDGENAVNIVQQRTAVAPVVEVRDQNNQPVAGAVVTFSIRRGRATFNGVRALTATTDSAGRATTLGLTPTGNGALQIQATATLQGRSAAVLISQTNVATSAEAAAVSAGSSASGGAGGAGAAGTAAGGTAAAGSAAATSGGVSATTIGVVAGGVAGGVLAATELAGSDTPASTGPTTYASAYSGQLTATTVVPPCIVAVSGTLTMTIEVTSDESVTGSFSTTLGRTSSQTCGPPLQPMIPFAGPVGGTTTNVEFGAIGPVPALLGFLGTLNAGAINGTLVYTEPFAVGQTTVTFSATMPITLR